MTKIRMTKADVPDFDADPLQVPHLRSVGWQVAEGQDLTEVEEWPEEAQRFGGQPGVKIHHPETGGETEVAESSWPFWHERGWKRADGDNRGLADLTVAELKERIREANKARDDDDQLSVSGTKDELIERLSYTPQDRAGEPAQDDKE